MAKPVMLITLGIDVSKHRLDIHRWETGETTAIDNNHESIKSFIRSLTGPFRVAIEPTSHYHFEFVDAALATEGCVYLVNPLQLSRYRAAVGVRAKTDPADAILLARFLNQEGAHLRPYAPRSGLEQQVWILLKRRAKLVKARHMVRQSLAGIMSIQTLIRAHNDVIARIDRRLSQLVDRLRWTDSVNRLQSIPGIGTLSGIALTAAYHRGVFASVDAFIAFLGLDVRVSDSGLSKGKRKLTKKGEPELRRLLYCAVTAATLTHPPFKTYLLSLRARGQSTIGSRCALARKLARTAFALLRNGQTFSPAEA